MLLKSALLFASAYGAALTFEHKKAPETNVFPGKDIVQDYESKDGTYKIHAEFHSREFDSNKDGNLGFGSIGGIEQELNKVNFSIIIIITNIFDILAKVEILVKN